MYTNTLTTGRKIPLIAFILFLGMFFLWAAPFSSHAQTAGLLGNWTFDEGSGATAGDSSGNGLAGTVSGATWTAGKIGQGLNFNGIGDYVNIPDSSILDAANITVSAWVRRDSSAADRGIIGKRANFNTDYAFRMEIDGAGNTVFGVSTNGTSGTDASTAGLTVGAWSHVVGTFDGSTVSLYVNGVLGATAARSGNLFNSSQPLRIGTQQTSAPSFWPGMIDDVRIYNRALSAAEISELYSVAAPPPTPDTAAPSVPANLSATAVSSSQINVSWSASTDNAGVTGYNVYRGSTQIATVANTSYNDTGLTASTAYSYTVSAYDAAGNSSAQSTGVSATTQSAGTPPPPSSGNNAPVIFYSDLDSGPGTGGENNNGVYVTIWGKNFGATRGTGLIAVGGGQAASYQLWSDTKIIFQPGANAATGNITVTTSNGASNGLPFTVRAGAIYFVSLTGTGNGLSVSTPMSPSAAYAAMGPGKTFYFRAGSYNQNYSGGGVYGYTNYTLGQSRGGTQGLPMAMVGYPNETVVFQTPDSTRGNIRLDGNEAPANYVTIANFTMMGGAENINGGGITVAYGEVANSGGLGLRVVGNIFSASYTWNTMTGMVTVRNNGARILGNEFKDTGTTPPINNNHAIYVQLGSSDVEVGWNYLRNLRMGHVIQVHTDKSFTYTDVRIHDNVITAANNNDSRGINIGIAQPGTYGAIYNNILYNVGQNFSGIAIYSGNWKVYNNTLYNINASSGMVWIQYNSATADVRNNIFSSNGSPYVGAFNGATMSQMTLSNNLYYNGGAAPSQDSAPVTGNPLFVNAAGGDFHIQNTSPAIDRGSSLVSSVVAGDHDLISRPQGLAYDIGAYEYASGGTTPPPPTPAPAVSFTANPTSVTSGSSATITWSSTNATSCTGSGAWSGAKATSGSQTLTNLTTTGTYTLSCTGSGGTTSQSTTITVTIAPDTTPPTQPTNLTATAVSTSQINLSWSASADPSVAGQTTSGISGYRIYRNGTQIATSPATSYSNTALAAGTAYTYTVAAVDGATPANVSPQSASASATTQSVVVPDTTLPVVSLSAPAGGATVSGTVTVSATATDNVGVVGVQFKLDNVNLGTEDTTSPYSTSWNTTSATNGAHTLLAVARDAAGNRATSTATTVTVGNTTPDTTAPAVTISIPTALTAYTAPTGTVTLGGTATDNTGVTQVTWSNSLGGTGTMTGTANWSATLTLQSGTNAITVTARDAAGNTGTDLITITYTPVVTDTQVPSVPANLSGAAVSTSQIDLSWGASTDNTAVTGYKVYVNGTQIATTTATSYSHQNLSPFTTYAYTVSAFDSAGNTSSPSSSLSVTTQAQATTPPPSTGGGGSSGGGSSGGGGGGTTSSGGGTASGSTTGGGTAGTSGGSATTPTSGTSSGTTGGGTTTTTPPPQTLPSLTGPFSIGMRNDQVKILQQMLIKDGSLSGEATGYYGPLTQKAVETFQTKYAIISSGTPGTTGFGLAGPGTRVKLNSLYGGGTSTATDQESLLAALRKQVAELTAILQTLIAKLAALKAAQGISQ